MMADSAEADSAEADSAEADSAEADSGSPHELLLCERDPISGTVWQF